MEREDNAVWVTVTAEPNVLKYIIEKGSITIDGISLTVAYVDDTCFRVSIIPHTAEETTLLTQKVGDTVNLECDMIGKYVERLLHFEQATKDQASKTPLLLIIWRSMVFINRLSERIYHMFQYNTIEEALQALRNGEVILVTDDEDRENEGRFDLCC